MSRMNPVAFDVRLHRQRIRRQELDLAAIEKNAKNADDATSNAVPVNLEDDEDLLVGTFSSPFQHQQS